MAKKKKEVVENTTKTNEPKSDITEVQAKMKKPAKAIEQSITKVDLRKSPREKEEDVQPVDGTKTEEVQEEVVEETTDKEEVV